jgi:voltage-gated potassium channel
MSSTQRKIILSLLFLSILVFGGTAGYMIIEGASFLDALFMTVITLTTIGYSEHVPLSKTGMVFTMILAISGVGFFFYIFSIIGDIIAASTLQIFSGKRMEGQIAKLKDHCILCGFGRVGKHVYEFLSPELPVVVIEKDPEKIEELQSKNILHIQGDATLEETLLKAGIERAKYLVATLGEDALNLYVVITARGLNPDIYIVSRANEHGVEKKLYQVGANRVFSLYHTGARKIALSVLKPNVVDFIDVAYPEVLSDLEIEEVKISEASSLVGKNIEQSQIRPKLNVVILAIRRKTGEMLFNPEPSTLIQDGDILIVFGERRKLDLLSDVAGGKLAVRD